MVLHREALVHHGTGRHWLGAPKGRPGARARCIDASVGGATTLGDMPFPGMSLALRAAADWPSTLENRENAETETVRNRHRKVHLRRGRDRSGARAGRGLR